MSSPSWCSLPSSPSLLLEHHSLLTFVYKCRFGGGVAIVRHDLRSCNAAMAGCQPGKKQSTAHRFLPKPPSHRSYQTTGRRGPRVMPSSRVGVLSSCRAVAARYGRASACAATSRRSWQGLDGARREAERAAVTSRSVAPLIESLRGTAAQPARWRRCTPYQPLALGRPSHLQATLTRGLEIAGHGHPLG